MFLGIHSSYSQEYIRDEFFTTDQRIYITNFICNPNHFIDRKASRSPPTPTNGCPVLKKKTNPKKRGNDGVEETCKQSTRHSGWKNNVSVTFAAGSCKMKSEKKTSKAGKRIDALICVISWGRPGL